VSVCLDEPWCSVLCAAVHNVCNQLHHQDAGGGPVHTHEGESEVFSIAVQTCPFDVQCATVTVEECFQTNTPSEP